MKLIIVVVVVCLLAAAGFFLKSSDSGKSPESVELIEQAPETEQQEVVAEAPVEEPEVSKLDQMQVRFDELKEMRKLMKLRVGRLSSRLRRSEFPPEQAKSISQQMRRANFMLKNPRLLGAFSDVDEIEDEIDTLKQINVRLDEIKALLDEKRKQS